MDVEIDESEDERDQEAERTFVVEKCPLKALRVIVRKIRKSTKLRQKLRQLCDVYTVKPLVPIIDVSTRWNSSYNMIKCGIHLHDPLNAICANEESL